MQGLRSLRSVVYCFLLLMLVNSSQALEVLTHDNHSGPVAVELEWSSHHQHGHDVVAQQDAMVTGHGVDDCLCDELCCVSSTQFAAAAVAEPDPWHGRGNWILPADYQSVTLDLLLPPPTA